MIRNKLMTLDAGSTFSVGRTSLGTRSMTVSTRLARKFQQTLGAEAAEDLVSWMDQMDAQSEDLRTLIARVGEWRDASRAEIGELRQATRADIAELRHATQAGIAELRQATQADIAELRHATQTDIADLRQTDIAGLRQDMVTGMSELRVDLANARADILKWSFVFWVTTQIAVVGALIALAP